MLTLRHFVVHRLGGDAEGREGRHQLGAELGDRIRGGVEIAGAVVRHGRDYLAVMAHAEQEELHLGTRAVLEAHVARLLDRADQRSARIPAEGLIVRRMHVADEAGYHVPVGSPWNDRERRGIGHQVHVAFGDPGVSFYAGTVEPDALRERRVELVGGNGQVLDHSRDVRELELEGI